MTTVATSDDSGMIPVRLWIGVTGHRTLVNEWAVTKAVNWVISQVSAMAPVSERTPLRLGVVSPLAEGMDRLVAHAVLQDPTATLEAALPIAAESYVQDFATEESRHEFEALLDRARLVTVLPQTGTREEAYEQAGHYVVDRSDVVIALWDGLPARGRGGTAEIVKHARERGVPLFLISSAEGYRVVVEEGHGLSVRDFREIDSFNRAQISVATFDTEVEQYTSRLLDQSAAVGLAADAVRPYLSWSVPHLVRADHLAKRFQRLYLRLGNLLYAVTFLAVGAAAVQALFSVPRGLAVMETVLAAVLLGAVVYGRRRKLHARWISYRRLAERFRIALFQGVAGLGLSRMVGWDRIDIDPSRDWVRRLFEEVWIGRPKEAVANGTPETLRQFLLHAWLEDQLSYHRIGAARNERRDRRLGRIVLCLVVATLVVAAVRGLLPWGEQSAPLLLIATTVPALASALSGMRAQREYLRTAENSRQMANHLRVLRRRMAMAPDLASIQSLAHTMGLLMLDENQDWYATMQPHDFEVKI